MKISKTPRVLVIDNYDSFTYNLVHLLHKLLPEKPVVVFNDQIDVDAARNFDKIIVSPGPGIPSEAGSLIPFLHRFIPLKPILGVCLGHQAIVEALGGKLINLPDVYHGIATFMHLTNRPEKGKDLFENIPEKFEAGRYHSWVADEKYFPRDLIITARDDRKNIMAFRHKHYPVHGVQFHPESVLTPWGEQILVNWLMM